MKAILETSQLDLIHFEEEAWHWGTLKSFKNKKAVVIDEDSGYDVFPPLTHIIFQNDNTDPMMLNLLALLGLERIEEPDEVPKRKKKGTKLRY